MATEATRFTCATATGKLNGQALAHEVGSMEGRHNVARIHRILVLNEAKAIHQLDLSDIPGAMGREMSLNIGLGR